MGKIKTMYICQECGHNSAKWIGKCPSCENWNSMVEEIISSPTAPGQSPSKAKPAAVQDLREINTEKIARVATFSDELNRLLGGGMVPGTVYLIGGDPGIGKSTLLLQLSARRANENQTSLYVSGEESMSQIQLRAERLGLEQAPLKLVQETCLERILPLLKSEKPSLLILDSIQTTYTDALNSSPGSVGQVREVGARLIHHCKEMGITAFLIGHVTKDGALAGPKVLEHLVDAVLYFEGDSRLPFRMLRSHKNRFGATSEIAMFEMTGRGLLDVENPSHYLVDEGSKNQVGSVITAVLEGTRPLLVEIQALVAPTVFPVPRRTCTGVDFNRVAMLSAVLEKTCGHPVSANDLYVNLAGGLSTRDPACDLAIVAAIISSHTNKTLGRPWALFGEVGLTGELRAVQFASQRLLECKRLGIKHVVIPEQNHSSDLDKQATEELEVHPLGHLGQLDDLIS